MTTITIAPTDDHVSRPDGLDGLRAVVTDIAVVTRRNLALQLRNPQAIVFTIVQPLILLVLYLEVFGGSIAIDGIEYVQYASPATILQAVSFGALLTGMALVEDVQSGVIQRYQTLPIARATFLAGRVLADAIRVTVQVLFMVTMAMTLGFRFDNGLPAGAAMVGTTILFTSALSWFPAFIAVNAKNAEAVQSGGFIAIFPLTFASSAFVPIDTLPGWLQPIATISPFTAAADATRALANGGELTGPLIGTAAWITTLVAVFGTLSVRSYRQL